ncbi:MAG: hypothetical protein FJ033_12910 [Chloroflexi bacterium]|nr:hypothetical protein [Chloroflexota bacterium]
MSEYWTLKMPFQGALHTVWIGRGRTRCRTSKELQDRPDLLRPALMGSTWGEYNPGEDHLLAKYCEENGATDIEYTPDPRADRLLY